MVWQKEYVNDSQGVVLRGLKEGLVYRVRVVAEGLDDQSPHRSEEIVVTVPGEPRPARPWRSMTPDPRLCLVASGSGPAPCQMNRMRLCVVVFSVYLVVGCSLSVVVFVFSLFSL